MSHTLRKGQRQSWHGLCLSASQNVVRGSSVRQRTPDRTVCLDSEVEGLQRGEAGLATAAAEEVSLKDASRTPDYAALPGWNLICGPDWP